MIRRQAATLLLWVAVAVLAPAQTAEQRYVGSAACQPCHPDVWSTFHRNPHYQSIARENQPPERSGCEGCHGPGGLHIAGLGDKSKIIVFPELAAAEILGNCLNCHSENFGKMQIRRSAHSTAEVSCIGCHSIHDSDESARLLPAEERQICYGCHLDIRARFELPFRHRVNEGSIDCSDCHNPHGAPPATWAGVHSPRMVRQAFGNDIACTGCHTDKRGPFVHEHPPVRVEGCTVCHEPHGSMNPRLLARPAAFTLCLECHSNVAGFGVRADGIPNPTAGFHNLAEPRFQNCVACHARIHGSNADPLFRR